MHMLHSERDLANYADTLSGALATGGLDSRVLWQRSPRREAGDAPGTLGRILFLGFAAFPAIPALRGGMDSAPILAAALGLVRAELAALQHGSGTPLEGREWRIAEELQRVEDADRSFRAGPPPLRIAINDLRFTPGYPGEGDGCEGAYYLGHRLGHWRWARDMDDGELRTKITAAVRAAVGPDFVAKHLVFSEDIAL